MARAFCAWWDVPLEDVTEWQDQDCEKNGMFCIECPFNTESPTAYDGGVEVPFDG